MLCAFGPKNDIHDKTWSARTNDKNGRFEKWQKYEIPMPIKLQK